ncbi:MAG: hypothetical protein ACI9DG_000050 [Oleispira sp.]|jgi:hypothetical protein
MRFYVDIYIVLDEPKTRFRDFFNTTESINFSTPAEPTARVLAHIHLYCRGQAIWLECEYETNYHHLKKTIAVVLTSNTKSTANNTIYNNKFKELTGKDKYEKMYERHP